MSPRFLHSPRRAFALALLLVLAGLPACSTHHTVTGLRPANVAPVPDAPDNVVRLFAWGWNHRDLSRIEGLLTTDFRFQFAAWDSAGNLFRDPPLDRETMIRVTRNVFEGGTPYPPARSITLTFDSTLQALPDGRPGMDPVWHQEIVTAFHLQIRTDYDSYDCRGAIRFRLVRGDSALIPADLGLAADSARWYMVRMEEETAPPWAGSLGTLPGNGPITWGQILARYCLYR